MSLKNMLKFKANDSISIVYFKGKEKAHSFYLPSKIFSTIKIIIIACLIWLPISIVLLYYVIDNENSSISALSKSKEAILSYQEKIDGVFENLYASTDQPSSQVEASNTDTTQIQQIPSSLPVEENEVLKENPIDIELTYNKMSANLLNVVLKITNKNTSLSSTTGRLLIALKMVSETNEESYILYPKDIISSIIPHVRKGESYRISRFKEINHDFSIPEGFKLSSLKVMVYNNQSRSSVEKQIDIDG